MITLWRMLNALNVCGGSADRWKLEAETDYCYRTMFLALKDALRYGLVIKSYHGQWTITDRGRIALAIYRGKQHRKLYNYREQLKRRRRKLEVKHEKLTRDLCSINAQLKSSLRAATGTTRDLTDAAGVPW